MKRGIWLLAMTVLFVAAQAEAIEPANIFIIQNIEYQSFDGAARLDIETNEHVDYIIYELENPYRIVIDPLDAVWCDFDQEVYFNEGMVRSIKFVKGREIPDGPDLPYYPFDFVTVELRYPYPYKFSEDEYKFILKIGEEKPPQIEIEPEIEAALPVEAEPQAEVREIVEEEERANIVEKEFARDVVKNKKEMKRAKDELKKKRRAL